MRIALLAEQAPLAATAGSPFGNAIVRFQVFGGLETFKFTPEVPTGNFKVSPKT
jgi:hypothetical protein